MSAKAIAPERKSEKSRHRSGFILVIVSTGLFLLNNCSGQEQGALSEISENRSALSDIPDSVRHKLDQLDATSHKTEYLLRLCEQWSEQKPKTARSLAILAEDLSDESGLSTDYARSLYWKAFLLNQEDPENADLQTALKDIKISIALFEKAGAALWLARALNLRALIHYNLYEENIGAIYNLEARNMMATENLSDDKALAVWGDIYRTAGNIELYTSRNTDTVLHFFDESYEYYQRIADTLRLARLLMNYAIVHDRRQDVMKADSFYLEAIRLYERLNNKNHIAKAYLEYATFYANRFREEKKMEWFGRSREWLSRALALEPDIKAEIYYQFGANFQNKAVFSVDNKKMLFDSATQYYTKALEWSVTEKNARYIEKSAKEIAKICFEVGQQSCTNLLTGVAFSYQEIIDSTRLALKEAASGMEQFKDEQAARERRFYRIIGGIIFLVFIAAFLLFYMRNHIRLLRKQLATQLRALRAQMNPHFISNSLNAIDSLVLQDRKEEASEYIIDFSRLCRLILDNSNKEFISLEKELDTLGYYLSLEQLRMGSNLSYTFDIDETLNKSEIQIPPMLLQPFIENAIMHGIQKKQAPGHVLISVGRSNGNMLECIIEDDGIGRKKAQELRKQSLIDRPSWGIAITQERIDALKKITGFHIEITDLFDDEGQAGGTHVRVHFPITKKPEI